MNSSLRALVLLVFLALLSPLAHAQATSQDSSSTPLGDIARQQRATPSQKKPPKVITNDDLVSNGSTFPNGSVKPDQTANPSTNADAAKNGQDKKEDEDPAAAADKRDEEYRTKTAEQKKSIAEMQDQLDKLQRDRDVEVSLSALSSGDAKSSVAKYDQDIQDKQKQLDDAKQSLEDTKEQGREDGVSRNALDE